jgi:anaerobic C4-dicarboxylate transporter
MTLSIFLQFAVVLAAIWMGSRYSGVGLGLWGAVGLLVLLVGSGVAPTSPPIDVMLIILAVIMAASVMDAAGGIDSLVRIAERIIRANPKYVTIVSMFVGKDLKDDPQYQARLAAGKIPAPKTAEQRPPLKPSAKLSAYLFPIGVALGIPPQFLIAMFPSVNDYFFIPTYGSLIAAINFDLSGTTRIGKYVLNHSFVIPGVVSTAVAVFTGLVLAKVIF